MISQQLQVSQIMIPYRENVFNNQRLLLPPQWERAYDSVSNRYFYVDHNNKKTTWINPLDEFNKPKSPSECRDDELPFGWERIVNPTLGEYYANHLESRNQWTNPVEDWRKILSQPYYSNSHHLLSLGQPGDSLESNNQTASQTTTETKPADTSLHASDIDDKFTASLNESNMLSYEIIDTMRSNHSTRGSRYGSERVDSTGDCSRSKSVEV